MARHALLLLLLSVQLAEGITYDSIYKVPKPKFVGVISRLPANGTIVATRGQTIRMSCQLTYPVFEDSALNITYWWKRENRRLWHSEKGKSKVRGFKFRVDDFMRKNRTIVLTIEDMKANHYGRYRCAFGTAGVQATTKVCIGSPTWQQLEVFCNSKLAKSMRVAPNPQQNPVMVQPNTTLTLTCRIEPKHEAFQDKGLYEWSINGDWYMWLNGKTSLLAPPGAEFSQDKKKQTWSMMVPNSTDLIGRRPTCRMTFRRITYLHAFSIVQAPPPPTPLPVKDMLPESGYFGVFLIFLMIWMLLALNANK